MKAVGLKTMRINSISNNFNEFVFIQKNPKTKQKGIFKTDRNDDLIYIVIQRNID